MSRLDLTKPVQTRDGHPVRILCTDRKGSSNVVVGLVDRGDNVEVTMSWTEDGLYAVGGNSRNDLINVPPKPVKYYVNVYRNMNGITTGAPNPDKPISTTSNDFIKTIEFEVP